MNLKWEGYLALAVELAARSDEPSWRCAISRAYYAVFNEALLIALELDPTYNTEGPDPHARLWTFFDRVHPSTRLITNIRENGKRLKAWRRLADYFDPWPPPDTISQAKALDAVGKAQAAYTSIRAFWVQRKK